MTLLIIWIFFIVQMVLAKESITDNASLLISGYGTLAAIANIRNLVLRLTVALKIQLLAVHL